MLSSSGTPRGQVPNYVNGYAVQSLAHSMPFDARGVAEFYSAVKSLKQELWLQSRRTRRDVADDDREFLRTRPHRPMAGGQVHPRDVAQLAETAEPRIALLDCVLVLLGRVPGADRRGRHVEPGVVRQLGRIAEHTARLGTAR